MDYRPFDMLPWVVLHAIFGQALGWYYAVLFGIRVATAWLLYLLARRVCGSALLAGAAAALWPVHPADSSVYWLTCFAYRFGLLFLLGGLVLLARRPAATGAAYWGSVACCALCLASNEIYLGLVLLLPLCADITGRSMSMGSGRRWGQRGNRGARLRRAGPYPGADRRVRDLPDLAGAARAALSWTARVRNYRTGLGGVVEVRFGWGRDGAGAMLAGRWRVRPSERCRPHAYDGRALITWMDVAPGGGGGLRGCWRCMRRRRWETLVEWASQGSRRGWWESAHPGIVAIGLGVAGDIAWAMRW